MGACAMAVDLNRGHSTDVMVGRCTPNETGVSRVGAKVLTREVNVHSDSMRFVERLASIVGRRMTPQNG